MRSPAIYGGQSWSGWDPNRTVTVEVTVAVTEFILVNTATGGRIVRPVGTSGGSDSDPSATPTTTVPPETIPPTPTPTLAPTATAPPATPAAPCPPGYTEIGGHCVDEFGNEPPGAGPGTEGEPAGPCPPGYTEIGGACVDEFGNEPPGAGP
jgi:hypothetical protein